METLDEWYDRVCKDDNMGAHAPRLRKLASECAHVTEFGTRQCNSTVAMLASRPERLVTYDIVKCQEVSAIEALFIPGFEFREQNVWHKSCFIEPTDMLFTDTTHAYRYLKREFELHASKVKKYIAIHDTFTCGMFQHADAGGLDAAIEELVWDVDFEIIAKYNDCCGMTVLKRVV